MTSLRKFYSDYESRLLKEPLVMENLFSTSAGDSEQLRRDQFMTLLNEAEQTWRLISGQCLDDKKLLEIGGGIALTYGFLKHLGYDVTAVEPGSYGFGNRYIAGKRLLEVVGIDGACWYPYSTGELGQLKQRFDLIFSNFVLEHILELEEALQNMAGLLSDCGQMLHRSPNYLVPYEPHLNVWLLPGIPRRTSLLRRSLRHDTIWQGLRFLTSYEMIRIARQNHLKIRFNRGEIYEAFERLGEDSLFRARKKNLLLLHKLLKTTGLLKLLKYLPPSLGTPMTVEITKERTQSV